MDLCPSGWNCLSPTIPRPFPTGGALLFPKQSTSTRGSYEVSSFPPSTTINLMIETLGIIVNNYWNYVNNVVLKRGNLQNLSVLINFSFKILNGTCALLYKKNGFNSVC
jgi:hypothetical protein